MTSTNQIYLTSGLKQPEDVSANLVIQRQYHEILATAEYKTNRLKITLTTAPIFESLFNTRDSTRVRFSDGDKEEYLELSDGLRKRIWDFLVAADLAPALAPQAPAPAPQAPEPAPEPAPEAAAPAPAPAADEKSWKTLAITIIGIIVGLSIFHSYQSPSNGNIITYPTTGCTTQDFLLHTPLHSQPPERFFNFSNTTSNASMPLPFTEIYYSPFDQYGPFNIDYSAATSSDLQLFSLDKVPQAPIIADPLVLNPKIVNPIIITPEFFENYEENRAYIISGGTFTPKEIQPLLLRLDFIHSLIKARQPTKELEDSRASAITPYYSQNPTDTLTTSVIDTVAQRNISLLPETNVSQKNRTITKEPLKFLTTEEQPWYVKAFEKGFQVLSDLSNRKLNPFSTEKLGGKNG